MSQPDTKGKPAAPPQSAAGGSHERPCPECGEMVRKGLVRCWNCGAFMDAKLQKSFQEMQSNPRPPIFSQVPADEMHSVEDTSEYGFQLSLPASTGREDLTSLESAGGSSAPAAKSEPGQRSSAGDPEGPSHSVATAGDVLFMAAMQEQAEIKEKRRRRPLMTGGAKTPTGFIIFCPYGCRIEVKEQHRGMNGKCPKCRAPFIVPIDPPDYTAAKKPAAEDKSAETAGPGGYQTWIDDLHVHSVAPEKLKLKADSLLKDFAEFDFAFGREGMLTVSLTKKGKFVGGVKTKADARAAMLQHLKEGKPPAELPAGDQKAYAADKLGEMRVVEPAPSRALSLFHGIPIFGAGRIAVMLPLAEDGVPQYVSMGIMQFRKFAQALGDVHGLIGFGAEAAIPATEDYVEAGKCHYLGTPVRSLKNLEFYKADPTVEVILSGWKCAACGLIISEDARQKEKLGGKEGKGLAKVKCPKCTQKFGENPMYALKQEAAQTSMGASEEEAAPTAAPAS